MFYMYNISVSAINTCKRLVLTYNSLLWFVVKEHYTGNKTRNAQVREDLPRAKVEQELEALRYQTYIQQQSVQFASFKNKII